MKNSVILISEKVPEKKLIKEIIYKYIPEPSLSKAILDELPKIIAKEIPENTTTEIDIRIIIKEYIDNVPQKEFWYDNKTK